jgi:NADH oxidase (H2O2-forming)
MRVLVVGGGPAGITAASTARETSPSSEVTVATEFEDVAYSPCAIPMVFGREIPAFDGLLMHGPEHYREKGIDLRTSTSVESVSIADRTARLAGQELHFDRLVLCTGFQYERPPLAGADLPGVHFIKNLRAAMALDKELDGVKRAVVIKGRPLGIEMATGLAHRGIETTLIDDEPWLMAEYSDPDFMKRVQDSLQALGVTVSLGVKAEAIEAGPSGRVAAVRTSVGAVPADLVVFATKTHANTRIAKQIGLRLGSTGAIVVDDRMRTSAADVFAAGDCTEVPHAVAGVPIRGLTATHAVAMGRVAGANAAGAERRYEPVFGPWAMVAGTIQIGGVALTQTLAEAMGVPYVLAEAEGYSRARYHPAMMKIRVRLLADPKTHRLIGCAMVGGENLKERADFLAFAMRKGATLEDIARMENCYSPPIGALNEPMALAAQAGLRKLGKPW